VSSGAIGALEFLLSVQLSLATSQIKRIEMLCDFLEHPALVSVASSASPVTMPPTVGSMGFDVPTWVGLGIVGLWAALDAYAERSNLRAKCVICSRSGCLVGRLNAKGQVPARLTRSLEEIEDLRHLFAHNFSGRPDPAYFKRKTRHAPASERFSTLTCGASFDGERVDLWGKELRHYAQCAREVLEAIK
jgi:hypothetical protein